MLAFFQKQPDNNWDWLGNAPINGVQPGPEWAFKAEMWNMDTTSSSTPYRDPQGGIHTDMSAVQLMNFYQGQLVSGWIAPGNAFLDALWASIGGGSIPGPPFADANAGVNWLQTQLAPYMFNTAGHVAPK